MGRSEWLMPLEKMRLPYNVGIIPLLIAQTVLSHTNILLEQAQTIKVERGKMYNCLAAFSGIEAFPSDANFILFRINNAKTVYDALKQQDILIKTLDGTHPFICNVSVETPEENTKFYKTLQTTLRETV